MRTEDTGRGGGSVVAAPPRRHWLMIPAATLVSQGFKSVFLIYAFSCLLGTGWLSIFLVSRAKKLEHGCDQWK